MEVEETENFYILDEYTPTFINYLLELGVIGSSPTNKVDIYIAIDHDGNMFLIEVGSNGYNIIKEY